MSTGPNVGKERCKTAKSRLRIESWAILSLRLRVRVWPSGARPERALRRPPDRASGGRDRWLRRPTSRPARGPPRPTSARASSSVPKIRSGPSSMHDDDAAIVELELLGAPPQLGRRGAGDGERAQQPAVRDPRAGRAAARARCSAGRGRRSRRAGRTPLPVTGTRRLPFAGQRGDRLALDRPRSSACAGSRRSTCSVADRGVARRTAWRRTSSRTLQRRHLAARPTASAALHRVALGGGDAGDLDLAHLDEAGVAQPHPAAGAEREQRRRARGRSAARGCRSIADHCRDASTRRRQAPSAIRASARPTLSTSPAPIVSSRSPSRSSRAQERLGRRVVAHPGDALAVAGVGRGLGDEQAGDAGVVLGGLARGVDVEDDRQVGRASAAPNARASRWVRLNRCGWKSATTRRGFERARGRDRRRDLGRVVRVVVDDERAGGGRAEALEAAAGALEGRERRRRRGRRRRRRA